MRRSTAKTIAALALTGAGSAIVVGFHTTDGTIASSTSGTKSTTAGTSSTRSTTNSATATPPPSAANPNDTAAMYADGTYTGTAVSEPWGRFQVQAVVSGGRLTDVVLVSSPSDGHSRRINSQAVPILTESAIAAQSANIDMVSGATWTSDSYTTSLQAALDKAHAAAVTG